MSSALILIIAIIACLAAYVIAVSLMPKTSNQYLKSAMERLEEQREHMHSSQEDADKKRRRDLTNNIFVKAYTSLPFVGTELKMIERAGLLDNFDHLIMSGIGLMIIMLVFMAPYGAPGLLLAPVLSFMVMYLFVKIRGDRRRKKFLDLFPDALDIIIRSVRAGYPINTAIGMVADSMPPDVGYEYLRVMNETAYGYSLSEAVKRFADRMNEPDISFFSVVISVQQETGGNLAEVLGNLSNVIRQRKHLRLKIKALSAEGRATVWILIGIAICMIGAVAIFSPGHFKPLLKTSTGHTVIISVAAAFTMAFLAIKKIVNFRI